MNAARRAIVLFFAAMSPSVRDRSRVGSEGRPSPDGAWACAALVVSGAIALFGSGGCVREASHACDGGCAAGESCIVSRCRGDAALPKLGARRVVLEPTKIALVSSATIDDDATVALGRASGGSVALLLAYDAGTSSAVEVKTATLSFSVPTTAPPPIAPVPIDAAVALEAWEPTIVSWGRQPRLDGMLRLGSIDTRGARTVRVDVTELVARQSAERGYGIAVTASPTDAVGATVHTGLGAGIAPRLELYLE